IAVETSVMTKKTIPSIQEILRAFGDLAAKPVPEAELERARLNLVRTIPRWFDTNEATVEAFAALALNDLPDDWFEQYRAGILKVSAADVRRAAKDHLAADRLVFVLVGDLSEIGAGLDKVGLGAAKRYDPDGVPIK